MDLKETLKTTPYIDFSKLKDQFSERDLIDAVKYIIKNEFDDLKEDKVFSENLFRVLSYLLLLEQARNQKEDKERPVVSKKLIFDKPLIGKIRDLYDIFAHPAVSY